MNPTLYPHSWEEPPLIKETDDELRARLKYITGRQYHDAGKALDAIADEYGLKRRVK